MPISSIGSVLPSPAVHQARLKAELVRSSVDVEITSGSQPQALLYRSAIDKLNEYLAPELGTDAIGQAAKSGMDFSPEAVAERILSFATGFFGMYAERHADAGSNEQLDGYMDLIRGAIEQGFNEARDILDGLGVFSGDVKANANHTYDLIKQGLDAFERTTREGFAMTG